MKRPLLVFVHVPKAAGSSINRALAEVGSGEAHVEKYRPSEKRAELADRLKDYAWVSGHVPIDEMSSLLQACDRPKTYFTIMREPKAQVCSHLNWLIEIFHRGRAFYEGHPALVKDISHEIRSSDLADPKVVVRILDKTSGLFLNYQTRYLAGIWSSDQSVDGIKAMPWSCIGTAATVSKVYRAIGLVGTGELPRENESGYHFDPAVFDHAVVREFLAEHNAADQAAWDFVQAANGCWIAGRSRHSWMSRLPSRLLEGLGGLTRRSRAPQTRD